MNSVQDKSVVITGGAEGIGYSIAEKFLENGAKLIIILDINEEKGENAVVNLNSVHGANKAVFIKCDVCKDIDETFQIITEKYQIDVLVNNAGIVDEESIRRTIEVNCIALAELSIKFFHHMRADKGGKGGTIVNIASISAVLVDPFLLYYKTSKYAVLGFSKSLGHECNYQWSKVRVICVLPGLTRTNLNGRGTQWDKSSKDFNDFGTRFLWQSSEDLAKRVTEVFGKAKSGTAWLITGGNPAAEDPPTLTLTANDLNGAEMFLF